MKWLEWKNCIINLHYVKTIYMNQDGWDDRPNWSLNLIMFDKEGKYVRHFESEEEARHEYEKIKKLLDAI